jgi:serine/threonine-protein kinase
MGSPGYTPPEQFSGRSSPRSDLYACAATILHALTGYDPASTPFCFPDLRAGFPDLAPHWNRILGKAMKLKPQERFASAEAMSAALRPLERFLSDEFPWPWLRRMRSMLLRLFRRRAAVSSTGGAERP